MTLIDTSKVNETRSQTVVGTNAGTKVVTKAGTNAETKDNAETKEWRGRLKALVGVKLGDVRRTFSPEVYERSARLTYGWLLFDLAMYVAFMGGVFAFDNPILKLVFGVLAGVATSSLFVWAHDAAHGALFGDKPQAEILGTIAMLPSLNMYRLWCYGHNKVHHGFTSFTPIDWIWRPHTRDEYAKSSRWSRFVYRIERSFAGCGLHYLLRVWWPGMVTFKPEGDVAKKNYFFRSRMFSASFALALGTLSFVVGGWWTAVCALVVPFLIFTYTISLFVYLHHTHPQMPFFDEKKEWTATYGQVGCSTIIRMSKFGEMLTHNIMVHAPHHVDMKIPFYRLKLAYSQMKPTYGDSILEYRWKLATIARIFSSCKLYDYETHTWYKYSDVKSIDLI